MAGKVAEREGGPPDYAVLTHPASWGQHRLTLLADAAAAAGLPRAGLLPEPVAAGLYYASQQRVPAGALIAVYDLGGGTFDATLLRKTATSFEVIGSPRGDDRLGGVDMDEMVLDHVVRSMGPRWPEVDDDDPVGLSALFQVRAAAVDAKEALSSDTQATVPVVLPGCSGEVLISRGEFERMVAPVVLRTVDLVRQTCASADVAPDELDAVLLVGGASRMPLVAELVTGELGRPVVVDAHPKYAVCLGAAIAAAARLEGRAEAPAAPPPPPVLMPPVLVPADPAEPAEPDAPVAIAVDLDRAELTAPSDIRLPRSRHLPMASLTLTDRDDKLVVRIGGDDGHGRREQSRVLVSAVAAAAVVAAVLAAVVAWGPASGGGSSGPPATGDGPSTTEVAAEAAGTARLTGGAVPVAAAPEAMLGATALDGSHLVAVGSAGGSRPAAWESLDAGATWSPAWTGESGTAAGVTAGPTGLVAVGWTGGEDEAGVPTQAAVWRSPDGSPGGWEPVAATGLEGAAALHDVVADGAGLVAVGRDLNDDGDDGDGGIWRSDDGADLAAGRHRRAGRSRAPGAAPAGPPGRRALARAGAPDARGPDDPGGLDLTRPVHLDRGRRPPLGRHRGPQRVGPGGAGGRGGGGGRLPARAARRPRGRRDGAVAGRPRRPRPLAAARPGGRQPGRRTRRPAGPRAGPGGRGHGGGGRRRRRRGRLAPHAHSVLIARSGGTPGPRACPLSGR